VEEKSGESVSIDEILIVETDKVVLEVLRPQLLVELYLLLTAGRLVAEQR
jgi:hypothetical protein